MACPGQLNTCSLVAKSNNSATLDRLCIRARSHPLRVSRALEGSRGGCHLSWLHGGSVPHCAVLEVLAFLKKISNEATFLRWLACSVIPDVYGEFLTAERSELPENTCLHSLWATVESDMVNAWWSWVCTRDIVPQSSLRWNHG